MVICPTGRPSGLKKSILKYRFGLPQQLALKREKNKNEMSFSTHIYQTPTMQ